MTKDNLLELFELNKGVYFSGEEIAKRLNVSRAAVWKAVNSLRNEGYVIDAITNKGYCLSEDTDILSSQGILKYMKMDNGITIDVLNSVTSTNALVREKADAGYEERYVAIANEQTSGRGRYGREFFSPSTTGVYMSILLRPNNYSPRQAVNIIAMAAVAMCEAIEEVSDKRAEIKWVNDIYIDGKKVCGILTEASYGIESGALEYAVLGLGVNVYLPQGGFPKEIEDIAGAIFENMQGDMKNHLVGKFLDVFMKYYTIENHMEYIRKYKERNMVVGKEIIVSNANENKNAYVYGIDDECRLIVKYDNGEEKHLSYGEVSIKI